MITLDTSLWGDRRMGKMVSLQLNDHKGVPAGHLVEVQQEAAALDSFLFPSFPISSA